MTVTVYTKPNCGPCTATKRAFDKAGVVYDEAPAVEHMGVIGPLGHTSAPVVVVRDDDGAIVDHWSGYRHGRAAELVG